MSYYLGLNLRFLYLLPYITLSFISVEDFMTIARAFRKYHRWLAVVLALPLLLTIFTGVAFTVVDEWFHKEELGEFLLDIHTLKILHLEGFYPLLSGLGLIGLLITGLSLTGLFKNRSRSLEG
jgi:hypothetical protein